MADAQPTDEVLVYRGGTNYSLQVQDLGNLLDTDLVAVQRAGVLYKETGLNVKIELDPSLDPDANAYIDNIEGAQGDDAPLEEDVKNAIYTLVRDLKEASVNFWDNAHFIWLGGPMRTMAGALFPLKASGNFNGLNLMTVNVTNDRYDRIYGLRCANVSNSGLDTTSYVKHPTNSSLFTAVAYSNIESTGDKNIVQSWRGDNGRNYRGIQMSANSFIGQTRSSVHSVQDTSGGTFSGVPAKTVQEDPLDVVSSVWPRNGSNVITAAGQTTMSSAAMKTLPWNFNDLTEQFRIGGDAGWTSNVPISGNIGFCYIGYGAGFDDGDGALLQEFNSIFTKYTKAINDAIP